MTDRFRVIIVDDHPLLREGVAHALSREPDIDVVAQGATRDEAIKLTRTFSPDMIVLDIGIPGGGHAAAQAISEASPATKIVVLTASAEEDDLMAALKAGARAYILKGISARELIGVLRGVWEGERYVAPTLAASLLSDMTASPPALHQTMGPLGALTVRERQILEQVAGGLSNKEIGYSLHLSEKTIKYYMTNILQKLRVRNRVEAAVLVQRSARGVAPVQGA